MATLTKILSDLTAEAFKAEGLDPAYGFVTTSDRPDLAQFQCNGALAAAKAAKANPRAIAFPIPLLAPVTAAVRPLSPSSIGDSIAALERGAQVCSRSLRARGSETQPRVCKPY